jgi:threonine dehydrogenase-like Zn-dependent dehydrogenase
VSTQNAEVPLDFKKVMYKELTITGALGYPTELQEVMDLMAQSAFDLSPLVSHRFAAADVMRAFDTARDANSSANVLVTYDGGEA